MIFPVFAGMVPTWLKRDGRILNFPRIRGDGPATSSLMSDCGGFSPYSRGWSVQASLRAMGDKIFPVFAGMVPVPTPRAIRSLNFPRIRGDGPWRGGVRHAAP